MAERTGGGPTGDPASDETIEVTDAGRIQQGDIIRWETPQPPWRVLGLVVTADCDIIQNKHADTLSCVPVMLLHDYWTLVALPKRVDRYLSGKFRQGLFDRIRSLQNTNRQEFERPISDEAIEDLLHRDVDEIMRALAVPEADRKGPARLIVAYKAATSFGSAATLHELARILAALKVAATPDGQPNIDGILDELAASVNDLPGDAFFIGRISAMTGDGFVAYLRLIREIRTKSIATSARALRVGAEARRIARLQSPFVYRLTQQLAQVFSDIGLPKAYEAQRERLAAATRNSIRLATRGG